MNATQTNPRHKVIERWLEEVRAAKDSLDQARENGLLHDDPTVDKYWRRYFRTVMSNGLIFEKEGMKCTHYWVIEESHGPISEDWCRNCGERRGFSNSVDTESEWEERLAVAQQRRRDSRSTAQEKHSPQIDSIGIESSFLEH